MKQYDFCVLGGDLRQVFLVELLIDKGYTVIGYGLKQEREHENYKQAKTAKEGIAQSKNIILPIPAVSKKQEIFHSGEKDDMGVEQILDLLEKGQNLIGGCLKSIKTSDGSIENVCKKKEVFVVDFMEDEELAVFNSIATAEGTIAHCIMDYPENLQGKEALVLGYGRCGKTLARKLKSLDAAVTISARKQEQLVWARTQGYKDLPLEKLQEHCKEYDIIINTIPQKVFSEEALKQLPSNIFLADIASAPGGFDLELAKKIGLLAFSYPGLPGKYASLSSAKALLKCICKNI